MIHISRSVSILVVLLTLLTIPLGSTASRVSAAPANVCITSGDADCAEAPANQNLSPEQELVDTFVPITMLKAQRYPCDPDGEAYVAAPIEAVLDDPNVLLRKHEGRGPDEIIKTAPNLADIANLDDSYYLDFPGNSRNPGCGYEVWARGRMVGKVPVTYANIVVSEELGKVAIQYWFWYVFNDFNNTHEGDWEMIQVVFDASSVEEALSEEPVVVGYSQHGGGESANWNDEKFTREGTHPVVYAAAGSHASKYGSGVYLGWGEDGSGFGCDITTGPSVRVELKAILVGEQVTDPSNPLAWTSFEGRWGERQRAFYNGPQGPYGRDRWFDPFTWQDGIRSSHIEVPESSSLGPGPTTVFCDAAQIASLALTRFAVYPEAIVLLIAAIIFAIVFLIRMGGATVRHAWGVYLRHWYVFAPLGLLLIPIGFISYAIQSFIVSHSPGRQIIETMNLSSGARLALGLSIGGVQQLVSLLVIGPLVIEAVDVIRSGRKPDVGGVFRRLGSQLRDLVIALIRPTVIIFALTISIFGLPWAIDKVFRWWFVSQAVLLDRVAPKQAAKTSERVVGNQWVRTAATSILLTIVGVAAGPVLGIIFLILASPNLKYVNALSSFIYAVMLPLAVIGSTLLYLDLKQEQGSPSVPDPAGTTVSEGEPAPVPAT